MRIIAISVAATAVLFLVSGGRIILIPLLFLPVGLLALRRSRHQLSALANGFRTQTRAKIRHSP